jgi:hypothetical protein
VKDANGQSLAYVYGRETKADASIANVLTMNEARRIASNTLSQGERNAPITIGVISNLRPLVGVGFG